MRWIAVALISLFSLGAYAAQPENGAVWHQPAATPMMERIESFHHILIWIIAIIVVVVTLLLAYVVVRFNAKANKDAGYVQPQHNNRSRLDISPGPYPVVHRVFQLS